MGFTRGLILADNITHIEMVNANGERIYDIPLHNSTSTEIDVSSISSGIYFIKSIGKEGDVISSQKIVIE